MKKAIFVITLSIVSLQLMAQANWNWNKMAGLVNCKRDNACGFEAGGYGYVCCGMDTNNIVLKDLWQYNPATNTWTQKADLPGVARRNPFSFSINGIGYVGSGIDDSTVYGTILSDFYSYDSPSNTWTSKAAYPYPVFRAAATSCMGKGYVFGGRAFSNSVTNVYEYNPTTDTWQIKTPLPPAPGSSGGRDAGSAFCVGTKIYFGLGRDDSFYDFHLWEYDPATDTWIIKADFPGGHRTDASGFAIGNIGFMGLGTDGGYKKDIWAYNPANNTWTFANNFDGAGRRDAACFVIGNAAYIATGKTSNGTKQDCYQMLDESVGITTVNAGSLVKKVFPIPATHSVTIQLQTDLQDAYMVLLNMNGQVCNQQKVNNTTILIDRNNLPAGTYLFKISNRSQLLQTGKILFE